MKEGPIGLFDEVESVPVEMVNGKPRVGDEFTLAELDMVCACEKLVAAHGKFSHWDTHPDKHTDKWIQMSWWTALNKLSDAEERVRRLFLGNRIPTLADNIQYALWRKAFLEGKNIKADA